MRITKQIVLGVTTAALLAAVTASPASARGFALYGTYWDTDQAGEAVGGGVTFEIPINEMLGVDLRGAYLQQGDLESPLDDSVDEVDDVFREADLNLAPLEAGLRFTFNSPGTFRPYVGGGVSYVILDLDSDRLEVDDETGWYGVAGAKIGDGSGIDFLVEAVYRKIEATVTGPGLTPINEIDLEEGVKLDVDGPAVNVGAVFTF